MLIYLMRHGQAESLAPSDRARALTEIGQQEVACVANSLRNSCPPVQAVFASPFVRARETAVTVSQNWLGENRIEIHDCLIPGGAFERILPVIDDAGHDAVLIVSHMPGISCLGGILTDADPNCGPGFSPAGIMCIETETAAPGLGCLRWYKQPSDWQ